MKGISATGKGTRMSTLIEFLKTVDAGYQSWFVTKIGVQSIPQPYQIALHFPKVNITFMGRWVKSNKIGRMVSWSSLDGFSAHKENYFDIATLANQSHYCCEGYFGGKSLVPAQFKNAGYDKLVVDHFLFADIEELQARCSGRSGERIKGSCYSDNEYFLDEKKRQRFIDNFMELAHEAQIDVYYRLNMSTTPAQDWGCQVLREIGRVDLLAAFLDHAQKNPTLRHVTKAQENIAKFSKYLPGDTTNIRLVKLPTQG
jgi:hypothetical protein